MTNYFNTIYKNEPIHPVIVQCLFMGGFSKVKIWQRAEKVFDHINSML